MAFRRWHRVLVHALLGVDLTELGEQDSPDLDRVATLVAELEPQVRRCRDEAAAADRRWPIPPTGEIAEGLPWSQYLALLHQLRTRLDLVGTPVSPVRGDGADDRESQRLRADRPPHW